MKKRRVLILGVMIVLILTGMITVHCSKPGSKGEQAGKSGKTENDKQKQDEKTEKGKKDTDSVPVQVIKPTIGDISSFILFSSNIDSEKVVDIFPLTSGIIEEIKFDEGQHVEKGDVLAVLDDREAALNEKKAGINYKKLKAEFERQEEIFHRKMLSKEDFERLKYNLDTAKVEWEQAKLFLSYTRITSPISGVVTKRYVKTGNKINTSQMAFSVVQDKEKIAVVNIPEQERKAVYLKQKAIIFSGNQETRGFVKRISPAIDPESGTFKVTIDVNDEEGKFAVGQFVNVKIIKKVHKDVILLTKDALMFEGGKVFIFTVNEKDEALKKQVKLGFEDGTRVEVLEGLAENERVVTAGKNSLKNKTLVRVIEPVTT